MSLPFSTDAGNVYSLKFYIQDVRTQPKVYFMNTTKYPLQTPFIRAELLG